MNTQEEIKYQEALKRVKKLKAFIHTQLFMLSLI